MDVVLLQALLALAMFSTTAFAGLIPIKILKLISKQHNGLESKKASWCITLLSCFAGGVFMGTCFLDIFPHVNNNYAEFRKNLGWTINYPFPEFFFCCGFFLVYFLEEVTIKLFENKGHLHSHGGINKNCAQERNEKSCTEESLKVYPLSVDNHLNENKLSNGNLTMCDENNLASEKYVPIMTHEIVIDEAIGYINNNSTETGFLKSLTFAVAMSFHSLLEGFALGVQTENKGILTLFFSLMIHKSIESFSVGLQISKSNSKRVYMVIMTIIVYALMTPCGSLIGVIIMKLDINIIIKEGIVILLEGFAGGTFIYVTFFEVLAQERANDHSNLIQLNAIIIGFITISGLQIFEHIPNFGHSHGH